MKIEKIKVYDYDELSDDAKETAITEIGIDEFFWWKESIESLKTVIEKLDSKVTDYDIDLDRYYNNVVLAISDLTIKDLRNRVEAIRGEFENDIMPTGYIMDYSVLEGVGNYLRNNKNATDEDVMDALHEGVDKWFLDVAKDYNSQFENAYIIDHCDANGYSFLESGILF